MSDRTTSTFQRGQTADQRQRQREELQHGVVAVLDKQKNKFDEILPGTVEWSDFRSCFLTAVQRNPRLLEADRDSLWLALQDCALAGLRPDGKEAALVIFGDDQEDDDGNKIPSQANAKKKVQLLPMAWGLCRLVHNTGLVSDVRARCVYEGESFRHWEEDGKEHYEYRRVIDPDFDDSPTKVIGAFAVIQYKDGSYKMDFMSRKQIERRRAVSRAKKGPWGPWYDEQSMKTVLKHVIKGAPKSRELQRVTNILDRDESLPTIEGEGAIEIPDADTVADPVRGAFSGDERKVGKEPVKRTTQATPSQTHVPPAQTAKRAAPIVDVRETEDRPPGNATASRTPEAPRTNGGAQAVAEPVVEPITDEGFAAWLVYPDGAETTVEPYTNPRQFAVALTALCAGKTADEINDIFSVNAGAISDCCEGSEAARRIVDAITEPVPSQDQVVREDTKAEPAKPVLTAIPVPATPKGFPHWPNYIAAVKDAIDLCQTPEELTARYDIDFPTYSKRSITAETQIKRHYERAMAALEGRDVDAERADAYVTEMASITTLADLSAMDSRADLRGDLASWEKDKPDLFTMVRSAAVSRFKELKEGAQ